LLSLMKQPNVNPYVYQKIRSLADKGLKRRGTSSIRKVERISRDDLSDPMRMFLKTYHADSNGVYEDFGYNLFGCGGAGGGGGGGDGEEEDRGNRKTAEEAGGESRGGGRRQPESLVDRWACP
jgi:hypothetical protein